MLGMKGLIISGLCNLPASEFQSSESSPLIEFPQTVASIGNPLDYVSLAFVLTFSIEEAVHRSLLNCGGH